jgi:hypothetical protein
MIPRWVSILALTVVSVGAVVTLWAGPNLATAVPVAGFTALVASGYVGGLLYYRVRWPRPAPASISGDPIIGLREAFGSGPIGRQKIILMVTTLERSLGEHRAEPVAPEEEHRLLSASRGEFHRWVDGRLRRLESDT